jgi:hypothetical protein
MKMGEIVDTAERSSGRTTRQLQSLNEGDIFIIPTYSMLSYVKSLCDKHNIPKVYIYSVQHVIDKRELLAGIRGKIICDHAIIDTGIISSCKRNTLYGLLAMYDRKTGT